MIEAARPASLSARPTPAAGAGAGHDPHALGEFVHGWGLRALNLLLTVPFGLMLVALPWKGEPYVKPFLLLGYATGAAMLALAAFVWWRGFVFRLTVYADRVVCRNVFGTRTLRLGPHVRFHHANTQYYVNGLAASRRVSVKFAGGDTTIKVDSNLHNVEQLQGIALELEDLHVFPPALERYRRGHSVAFGPLSLQNGQLTYRGKTEPLAGLDISLEVGRFYARKDGKWFPFCRVLAGDIPNLQTLMKLIRASREPRPQASPPN